MGLHSRWYASGTRIGQDPRAVKPLNWPLIILGVGSLTAYLTYYTRELINPNYFCPTTYNNVTKRRRIKGTVGSWENLKAQADREVGLRQQQFKME